MTGFPKSARVGKFRISDAAIASRPAAGHQEHDLAQGKERPSNIIHAEGVPVDSQSSVPKGAYPPTFQDDVACGWKTRLPEVAVAWPCPSLHSPVQEGKSHGAN
jgi:hypothetical protein